MMNDTTDNWKKLKLVRRHFMQYFKQMSGNGKNWPTQGFSLREDGIWVESDIYSDVLLGGEAEVFHAHPKNDLSIPALPFPCDFNQANSFFDWFFEETGFVFKDLKIFMDSDELKKLIDSNEFVVEMDTNNLRIMWLIEYQKKVISTENKTNEISNEAPHELKSTKQSRSIFEALDELKSNPLELKQGFGKTKGDKFNVWEKVKKEFISRAAFDSLWQRMLDSKELINSKD